jgi:hypothetical protein
MSAGAVWQCAVCETINHGGRTCGACGAAMTRRSTAVTKARGRLAPLPPLPEPGPLADPLRRAVNREPIEEEEWGPYEPALTMLPLPGGCLFNLRPRRIYL